MLGLMVVMDRCLNLLQKRFTIVGDELKAISASCRRIIVNDRVVEPSRGSDDGNRPILQAIDLIEATGFIPGGHQEEIRSSFDLVGQPVIVSNADPGLLRILIPNPGKEIMVFLISSAQKDEPNIEAEKVLKDFSQKIKSFLIRQSGNDT